LITKAANAVAFVLLALMALLAMTSVRDDSATSDELAHIPAGYSYVTQHDYRLNPEHPPLVKDLAGLMLLPMGIEFPTENRAWTDAVNTPWPIGVHLLYASGADVDTLLWRARLPIIFIMLLLGYYVYRWAREFVGKKAALFALFLYVLSPSVLAHGRLVTTDVAVAAGFFITCYHLMCYLKNPTWRNLTVAGIVFGLAQLAKFSAFILVPYMVLIFFLAAWVRAPFHRASPSDPLDADASWGRTEAAVSMGIIMGIGYAVVGLVYLFHVWDYPSTLQAKHAHALMVGTGFGAIGKVPEWLASIPMVRAYGPYLVGFIMALARTSGGTPTYFLGDVSRSGWWYYFPVVYLIKEPLALHLLSLIAFLFLGSRVYVALRLKNPKTHLVDVLRPHLVEAAMIGFVILYWIVSIHSRLNIGIRHILPTFPFLYALISKYMSGLWDYLNEKKRVALLYVYGLGVTGLLLWYMVASFMTWPSYIAYFNELAGGPDQGYKYVVDSNLDWGQDLKRLSLWVQQQGIEKIKVAYFGGDTAVRYYLGPAFEPLRRDAGPQTGWIAVSATLYQTVREPGASFAWLDSYRPVAKIGYSIFVYKIE
jgi:hypothetical protein